MEVDSKQAKAVSEIRAWVPTRIRDIRIARGLTQLQLSKLMGVHFTRVSDFENNVSDYKASTIYRAARALGVTLEQVFRGCPKMGVSKPDCIITTREKLIQLLVDSGVPQAKAASVVSLIDES